MENSNISSNCAHETHITHEIVEIFNVTRPTLLKVVTSFLNTQRKCCKTHSMLIVVAKII